MKKIFNLYLLLSLITFNAFVYAKEPTNLSTLKEQVIHYHDSGEYEKDTNRVMAKAMEYLKQRVAKADKNKKMAIILDIDETSLSNYPDMKRLDFGGTIEEMRADEDKGEDEPIASTLALYQYAKKHGVAVFFITGRHDFEREPTVTNLNKVGFTNFDGLILRNAKYRHVSAAVYKTDMRRKLTQDGYDIILNIGDQESDLAGGYADKTFKLPNPYYFIP